MQTTKYKIVDNSTLTHNVFRLTLSPLENDKVPNFKAGQFVYLLNKDFDESDPRPFSISSPPEQKKTLEFSIKVYGNWTRSLSQKKSGEIFVSKPYGDFIFKENISHAVFLLAGIGIAPIMSMLRSLIIKGKDPKITMLYGNLIEEDIVYREELESFKKYFTDINIQHILSEIPDNYPWQGYRGFINQKIIEKEAGNKNADYFVIGQPAFMEKMLKILEKMEIPNDKIHMEKIDRSNSTNAHLHITNSSEMLTSQS